MDTPEFLLHQKLFSYLWKKLNTMPEKLSKKELTKLETFLLHRQYSDYGVTYQTNDIGRLKKWCLDNIDKSIVIKILLHEIYDYCKEYDKVYKLAVEIADTFCSCWLADDIYFGRGCKSDINKTIELCEKEIKRDKCAYSYWSLAYIYNERDAISKGKKDDVKALLLMLTGYGKKSTWCITPLLMYYESKNVDLYNNYNKCHKKIKEYEKVGIEEFDAYYFRHLCSDNLDEVKEDIKDIKTYIKNKQKEKEINDLHDTQKVLVDELKKQNDKYVNEINNLQEMLSKLSSTNKLKLEEMKQQNDKYVIEINNLTKENEILKKIDWDLVEPGT